MKRLWKNPAVVAVATLIVGLAVGLGIGFTTRSAHASQPAGHETASPSPWRTDEWDPMREMERMQEQVDHAIRHAAEQLRLGSEFSPMTPGYSSSFDLRDRRDHFELRAYLPDAQTADVKVTTEGDNALRVSVTHRHEQKKQEQGTESAFTELGRYEQLITLPEPVNTKDMKIQRNDHELVITVPKVKAS